jgi:hypothetical protein
MTDEDLGRSDPVLENYKSEPFKWALTIWFRPAATFRKIIAVDGKAWWLPLVFLSTLQIIKSIFEIPARKAAILMTPASLPQGMNSITPEQQAQINQSLALKSGPFFTFILPVLLGLAGIWITWLLLSSILHISLTLSGSRSSSRTTFNIAAWASLPIALRLLIQSISILATKVMIDRPGLSGFINIQGRLTLVTSMLLGMIDLFFILQLLYLIVGTAQISGVKVQKAILTVVISLLIVMAFSTLPGFISYTISGMNITRPFFL